MVNTPGTDMPQLAVRPYEPSVSMRGTSILPRSSFCAQEASSTYSRRKPSDLQRGKGWPCRGGRTGECGAAGYFEQWQRPLYSSLGRHQALLVKLESDIGHGLEVEVAFAKLVVDWKFELSVKQGSCSTVGILSGITGDGLQRGEGETLGCLMGVEMTGALS